MSRNGSGTYTLPAGNPVVSGTTITTTWGNTTLTDIANSLTGSVAADGQTPMTGALNMGSNKITAVTDPTSAQDAATKAYVDISIPSTAAFLVKTNNLSDVTSATTSRTNLVAAKSGANSDITSITGLTTPLTVAQGGIGAATLTANNVLLGNGTSAFQVVAPSTSGNVLTSNGTTWVSSAATGGVTSVNSVTGAVVTTNLYSIGSFVIGRPANYTVYGVNSTIAGSSLYSTSGNNDYNRYNGWEDANVTLVNTGSWRCVSPAGTLANNADIGSPGLWVRYS